MVVNHSTARRTKSHKEARIVRPTWLKQVMGKKGGRNGDENEKDDDEPESVKNVITEEAAPGQERRG